jgi:hypothetical protein
LREVKSGEWNVVKWCEVKILGEIYVLLLYSYAAAFRFCAIFHYCLLLCVIC